MSNTQSHCLKLIRMISYCRRNNNWKVKVVKWDFLSDTQTLWSSFITKAKLQRMGDAIIPSKFFTKLLDLENQGLSRRQFSFNFKIWLPCFSNVSCRCQKWNCCSLMSFKKWPLCTNRHDMESSVIFHLGLISRPRYFLWSKVSFAAYITTMLFRGLISIKNVYS